MTQEADRPNPQGAEAIVPFAGDSSADITPFEPQDPQAQLVAFSPQSAITPYQRHQLEGIANNHEALELYLDGARHMWPIMAERREAPNNTYTETLNQMRRHYPAILDITDEKIEAILARHPQIEFRVGALRDALAAELGEEIFEETGLSQSALTLQVLGDIAAHPTDHMSVPDSEDFNGSTVEEPVPTVIAAHLFSADLAQYWVPDDYSQRPVANLSEEEETTYRDNLQGPIRTVSRVLGVEAYARNSYSSEVARLTGLRAQIDTLTRLDPESINIENLTIDLESGINRLIAECPSQFENIIDNFGDVIGEGKIREFQFQGEIAGIRALQALYTHVDSSKGKSKIRKQKLTDLIERLHRDFPERGGEILEILGDTEEIPFKHDRSWTVSGPNDPTFTMSRAEMIGFLHSGND